MWVGASSTVEDEKEKNTIGGDPKIWAPIVGKVDEGSLEEISKEWTITDYENRIGKKVQYCYKVHYTAESSFAALNQGWPSSNFSATSGGNSASLGGCMKRFRDQ